MHRSVIALLLLFATATVATAQPAGSGSASTSAAPTPPPVDSELGRAVPPGGTLQVYTKPIEPFAFQKNDKAEGFSLELWDKIAAQLGVKTELHWVKTVSDLIEALKSKQADVAIAAISITSQREQMIDFTTPYYESGLGILVNAQGKGAWDIIKETFFTATVGKYALAVLLLLVLCAHLVWFFERHVNAEQFPKPYAKGIWESTWWGISTILSGGCDAKGPTHVVGRIFGGLWMLVCIVVITYFTAQITTVMTVSQLTSDINGPNELPGKKVATVKSSTAEKYLQDHGSKVSSFDTIDGAFEALDKSDVIAVVYDKPILAYHLKNAGVAGQSVVGLFQRQNYGIGLQDRSPYRKQINAILLKMEEDGTIDDLRTKWFGDEQ